MFLCPVAFLLSRHSKRSMLSHRWFGVCSDRTLTTLHQTAAARIQAHHRQAQSRKLLRSVIAAHSEALEARAEVSDAEADRQRVASLNAINVAREVAKADQAWCVAEAQREAEERFGAELRRRDAAGAIQRGVRRRQERQLWSACRREVVGAHYHRLAAAAADSASQLDSMWQMHQDHDEAAAEFHQLNMIQAVVESLLTKLESDVLADAAEERLGQTKAGHEAARTNLESSHSKAIAVLKLRAAGREGDATAAAAAALAQSAVLAVTDDRLSKTVNELTANVRASVRLERSHGRAIAEAQQQHAEAVEESNLKLGALEMKWQVEHAAVTSAAATKHAVAVEKLRSSHASALIEVKRAAAAELSAHQHAAAEERLNLLVENAVEQAVEAAVSNAKLWQRTERAARESHASEVVEEVVGSLLVELECEREAAVAAELVVAVAAAQQAAHEKLRHAFIAGHEDAMAVAVGEWTARLAASEAAHEAQRTVSQGLAAAVAAGEEKLSAHEYAAAEERLNLLVEQTVQQTVDQTSAAVAAKLIAYKRELAAVAESSKWKLDEAAAAQQAAQENLQRAEAEHDEAMTAAVSASAEAVAPELSEHEREAAAVTASSKWKIAAAVTAAKQAAQEEAWHADTEHEKAMAAAVAEAEREEAMAEEAMATAEAEHARAVAASVVAVERAEPMTMIVAKAEYAQPMAVPPAAGEKVLAAEVIESVVESLLVQLEREWESAAEATQQARREAARAQELETEVKGPPSHGSNKTLSASDKLVLSGQAAGSPGGLRGRHGRSCSCRGRELIDARGARNTTTR